MQDSAPFVCKCAAITYVLAVGVDGHMLCLVSAAGMQVEKDYRVRQTDMLSRHTWQ